MLEFIAVGPGSNQHWRRVLPDDRVIRLGRAPLDGWDVPWDMRISRDHADIVLKDGALQVKCLRSARNSIYFRGEPSIDFSLQPGESFRIGVTTFHLETTGDASVPPRRDSGDDRLDEALEKIAKQSSRDRLELLLSQLDTDTSEQADAADGPDTNVDDVTEAEWSGPVEEPAPIESEEISLDDATALATDMGLPNYELSPESDLGGEFFDGAAFGNYELVDQVYRGGTGQVLKARHRFMDRTAAIKLLSLKAAEDEETLARFRRKTRLHSYFDHANLVSSYDAGELEGMHYLIMEYVDGVDLVRLLQRGSMKVSAAVSYITQACEALVCAHERGMVHRNINPTHLLVDRRGIVKLIGWGCAKYDDSEPLSAHEGPGKLIGVLDYIAPEQLADSSRVDHRADIYSLGCTLFAILTRRVVYPVEWPRRKAIAQRYQPAPSLQEFRADVPDELEAVYQQMMIKSPKERFQTARGLLAALQSAM